MPRKCTAKKPLPKDHGELQGATEAAATESQSQQVKFIQRMPIIRDVTLRDSPEGKEFHLKLLCHKIAALCHRRGTLALEPCKDCSLNKGPFTKCILLDGQLHGGCTNCYPSHDRCSHAKNDQREEARTWTTEMRRTKRLKSEEQQHELSPSTSTPKLMPPPNDVVASPSVSEDFIVIGALELASPSKYDLAPGHLKLLLDVLDDLQKTVQRNRDSLCPQWPSLEVGFQRFRTKETAAWKASGHSPDSRSRLIRPSGSLESKVAHYLHQPSFKTKAGPDSNTADLSNPCTAIVMGHGFRRGETLLFDHILRQDERSEGLKDYPPQVLQAHEDFAYDILASTHSVVVVVYGSHVQERILRSQKIKKTVVPLWGECSDVLLVLIHENSFENEEEHYRFRSIVVFASHPQCLFYQPRDGPVAKRQDKTLKVGFQIADHTIQFDEDYYRSQKWRRAISESKKAHYLQAASLALADKAPGLLSLQEPIVDLQAQANDPGGNSRRNFGKWDSFFNPRPHSNDTLRKLLPRVIEATKPANSKEWLSFSDCDLDTQEWLKGNGPILFYDQPISSVEDVSKVLVRCMEANDRSNRIPLVESLGLRAILNELMQIQEAAFLKETRANQDLWHSRFDGQTIDIVCPCGAKKLKDTRPGFACRRNSAYIQRKDRCYSGCLNHNIRMKPVEDIESVHHTRISLLSYVPVSETTRKGERYASLLRSSKDDGPTCPAVVECWCIICQEDTELVGGGVVHLDDKARWTLGFKRPLYVERQIHCLHCKNKKCGRFVPINKNIPSIYMNALGLFEAKFGTLSKTFIAAVLDNWPPSCRESRSIRIAADEESHENRVDTTSTAD